MTQERLGHLEEAVSYLRRYLESGDVPEDRRQVLTLRLENLERRLAGRDDPEPEPDPSRGEADQAVQPETQPPPVAPAPPAAEPQEGGGVSAPTIVSFGAAGVGAVLWATFGILAMNEDSSLEDECAARACTDDDVSSLRTYGLVADIGFGITLAGATVGLLLLALGGDDAEEDPSVAFAPWGGAEGAGLTTRGTF